MGLRPIRKLWIAPLLVFWFASGLAAAQAPQEQAWRAARAAIEQKDYARAEQLTVGALERFQGVKDLWYWELHVLRGFAFFGNGQHKAAVSWLERELPPPFRESATDVRRLLYLGMSHWQLRDRDRPPDPFFAKARRLARRHPDVQAETYAMSSLIDGPERESYARASLEIARSRGDRFFEIFALNQLAFLCNHDERYAEAIHWFEALIPLASKRGLDWMVEKAEGNLGWAFLELGDFETAAELFNSAQRTAARVGARDDDIIWTNQKGNVALQIRDYASAERYCADAIRLARGNPTAALGHAFANLARVALENRRFDLARCRNDAALAVKIVVDDRPGVLRSRILNAQIGSLLGHHTDALKTLGDIASSAKDLSVRWEAQARMAQALVLSNQYDAAEAQFRKAAETVSAARAGIENRDLRFAFFRVAEDVFDGYVDFLVERKRDVHALEVTEKIRAQTLEEGLGIKAPKTSPDPRTLARRYQATILCYWLGRERSYVWVITPDNVTLKILPPDLEIEKAVDAYRRAMRDPRIRLEQTRPLGEQLHRMLVTPAAVARGSRVIVVPDGRMHVLNLESLMVPGSPQPRFWIEDVTLVSSGSLQLLERAGGGESRGRSMLLVGDAPLVDAAYPPLSKAKLEIDKVRRHFTRPVVLEGARATPAAFHSAAPESFDYLHFVAHGEATSRKPLDAAVILGKDGGGSYKLLARDIIDEHLTARLVTVSSCHGAGTRAFVGEGLVGLAWAFLRAGAQQVVAALWQVDDVATPGLMDAMYAGIAAGKSPAAALREAKLKLVQSKGIHRKPFYWAPFVLYGGM